jgi:hypothetical protein
MVQTGMAGKPTDAETADLVEGPDLLTTSIALEVDKGHFPDDESLLVTLFDHDWGLYLDRQVLTG